MARQDHGITLVHDTSGNPLWNAHEVSVSGPRSEDAAYREGYRYSHGWIDDAGKAWKVMIRKEFVA